jgi:16S rRNA (adenine1518-N6/adenine1519-N6)-dimethyltransferase
VLEHYVRQAMQRARIVPSRARGQHFLVSDEVLSAILRAGQLDGSELVVEVGPGLGTLTQSLAARAWRVAAYELDDTLVRYLRNWVLPEAPNIELHETAFNKYAYENLLTAYGVPFESPDAHLLVGAELAPPENATLHEGGASSTPTVKIITNLPYQISSAFLHFAVDYVDTYERIVVMLQREVAQRVIARTGDKGYNSFSLYLQTYLEGRWVYDVPAESFYPPPRVESAVLHLRPLRPEEQPQPRDRELYLRLIQGVFKRRRKQLVNAAQQAFGHLTPEQVEAALSAAGISPSSRAGELGMAEFVKLADALSS